jgi:hypothetical protein
MQPIICPFLVLIFCLPALQMSAFHNQMTELNMSEKILVRDGKRAIRADLKTSQQPSDLLDDAPAEVLIPCYLPATLLFDSSQTEIHAISCRLPSPLLLFHTRLSFMSRSLTAPWHGVLPLISAKPHPQFSATVQCYIL